jgi:thioredoxin reductase (NADPH)
VENVQVLIVGGGMAGISAAIWCARLGLSSVLIEREPQPGGQLWQIHNEIWDFPPQIYDNGAALLAELQKHKALSKLDFRFNEQLLSVDFDTHRVTTDKAEYFASFLIVATGVRPNAIPQLSGCSRLLAPWFSTSSQVDIFRDKNVLIIGGGDRALESACNIAPFARSICLAVRSSRLRGRAEWAERVQSCENVRLLFNTEAVRFRDEAEQTVVTLKTGIDGNESTDLSVDWILPRIGVRGNSEQLPGLATYGEGFLSVDPLQSTNVNWIYAIGDVTNGAAYASLSLAAGQAMKAVKHISLQMRERENA